MTKKILIFFYLLVTNLCSQSFEFAWLTDIHIGASSAVEDLNAIVDSINKYKSFSFVIISGDISEKGKTNELAAAKEILDRLNIPYYVIPGNHDFKWSESAGMDFYRNWLADYFVFEKNNIKFIGLNSSIIWRGGGGHFSPESLRFLDSVVTATEANKKIIFISHHAMDGDIDNWFLASNILRKKNIVTYFYGHGHTNKISNVNGIPSVMSRAVYSGGKSWGYTSITFRNDSLFFTEKNKDNTGKQWAAINLSEKRNIAFIDSLQFNPYDSNIFFKFNINKTQIARPATWNGFISAVSYDGSVFTFNNNGKLLWEEKVSSNVVSSPVIDEGILCIGTLEGDLYTFDVETGELLQTIGIGEKITSQLTTIESVYFGQKTKGIVIGTSSGKVYCLDIFTLNEIWSNEDAKGMIESKPLFIQNRIVYGSWDGFLYCVDSRTGFLNWKWTENQNFYFSPAACSPVTDGKYVYIATPDKFVSKIDLMLGKTIWRKEFDAWESIGFNKDLNSLVIKSLSGKIIFISPEGKKTADVNLKIGTETIPHNLLSVGNNVLTGSKQGIVFEIINTKNFKPILFLGTARTHDVQSIKDNLFLVSNMDGTIVVFSK